MFRTFFSAVSKCFVLAACLAMPLAPAGAEKLSPVQKGKEMVERLCKKCHATGRVGASPMTEAPPLRTMAHKWPLDSLEEAFAEGIVVGHPAMPQFSLEPGDIHNLLSYLHSISR